MTATASRAFDRLLDALRDQGSHVIDTGHGKARARCPAHDDHNPSLSITGIDGQVLVHCHAGCPTKAVVEALNLQMADLFDTRSGADYRYPDGRIVHRKLNKTFPQSGNTKGTALFHADRIADATPCTSPKARRTCWRSRPSAVPRSARRWAPARPTWPTGHR